MKNYLSFSGTSEDNKKLRTSNVILGSGQDANEPTRQKDIRLPQTKEIQIYQYQFNK